MRAGHDHAYPVLSVTKHNGFVESRVYFRKRVFSEDTSQYKLVLKGQFAYSTIHLDEGALGLLTDQDAGVISPMYKVFRVKAGSEVVDPAFLYAILKSAALMNKYRNIGKGSIKRRKSIAFEKFLSITVPIPPPKLQQKVVLQMKAVNDLEVKLVSSRELLAEIISETLQKVGLA